MNCRSVQQRLSDDLEGLLPRRAAEAVAAHLRDCPACRALYGEYLAAGAALREPLAPTAVPDVDRRALEQWRAGREAGGQWSVVSGQSAVLRWVKSSGWTVAAGRLGVATAVLAALLLLIPSLYTHWQRRLGQDHGVRIAHSIDRIRAGFPMNGTGGGDLVGVRPPGPHAGGSGMRTGGNGWRKHRATEVMATKAPSRPTATPVVREGGLGAFVAMTSVARLPGKPHASDDLQALNAGPGPEAPRWTGSAPDPWARIEARVRRGVSVKDDFVTIPFPRLVSTAERQIAQAAESYRREAAVVDARLAREVTCAFKAAALSDICDRLRADTGIPLTAGESVADEKITLFCEKLPLRDVMRQLSRPFGYTWLRTRQGLGVKGWGLGKDAERPNPQYRYELVQDLRSQLLEEELRNRDRNAALLALEKDLERYRPYLDLSPDEALERAKTASPAEKPLLEALAGRRWGPLHMYFRLTSQEQAALRAGKVLRFTEAPRPGEQPRPEWGGGVLPPEIGRGVLQSLRWRRLVKSDDGWEYTPEDSAPAGALPPAAIPEARGEVRLRLEMSDLGQFTIRGTSGVFTIGTSGGVHWYGANDGDAGSGRSTALQQTDNAAANAALARDPALRGRVNLSDFGFWILDFGLPAKSGTSDQGSPKTSTIRRVGTPLSAQSKIQNPISKITSAEVLEALHRATGMPIVSDFYTRLFKREAVSVRSQPLYDALNQLGDAMRVRWHKEGNWLQFRSVTFFDDRRKEVPNRLLSRWSEARRAHGALSLDDLTEIAQLADPQLDATEMAEGARELWGLAEWDLARGEMVRPHLRYLAQLTPDQRRQTMSATGLPFLRMSLAQQQQFMAFGLGGGPLQSLDELAGAALRVEYTEPGAYQWGEPGWSGYYTRWVIPLGPGPQDRRMPRPPVTGPTREEALAAVRRVDPGLREALFQAARRVDPRAPDTPAAFEEQQIFPTQRDLTFVYIPGATNARYIYVLSGADRTSGQCGYRLR